MANSLDAFRWPLRVDAQLGGLEREHDRDTYIEQLIRQVLLTSNGERINRPDFGAGLRRLVFAPNNPATASLVQASVKHALDTWLGALIRAEEITAEADEEKLLVRIAYVVLSRGERRLLNLEVTL